MRELLRLRNPPDAVFFCGRRVQLTGDACAGDGGAGLPQRRISSP